MADKSEATLTYDKALQLAAPIAWIVLGLLGWSLDSQVNEFKNKLSGIDSAISQISENQHALATNVAEIKVRQQQNLEQLSSLSQIQRERGNQTERLSALVNELVENRREERKAFFDSINPKKGSIQ